jgi:uncharacterized Rmd1/YagE family protein
VNYKLIAINISDSIDIKSLKSNFLGTLITSTSTEIFYKIADNKFISIFNYGVIAFSEYTQQEIEQVISIIKPYLINEQNRISETIEVSFDSTSISYQNNILSLPIEYYKDEIFRIVMFDLGQSIALDYYSSIGEKLLGQVKAFAAELEEKGKISLNKKEMMKFIGKSLNTKNKIIDTLYIFDSPDIAWESEKIDKIHKYLVRTFDLIARFKEVEYTFNIVDGNLQMFKDTYEHQHSATLEIVVIILILIEILQTFGERFHLF